MDTWIDPVFIRNKALERKARWSIHALGELALEDITVQDVERSLTEVLIIEDYPHRHRFLPDCLVLAFDPFGQPLHCVVAVNEHQDYLLIVTVYRPGLEEWEDGWRKRK